MDATNDEIKEEFKRQVRLCGVIGKDAMLSIIAEKFPPDTSDGVEIKLDRTTLPKDGQAVSFQTQNEEWHDGYFVDGDDLFWVNESTFYPAFDILKWKPNV